MKKLLIGLLAMTAVVFSATAQEPGNIQHFKHARKHGMMLKELNLTAAQKDQLKANRQNIKNQMAELNKNEDITVRDYKARKAAILQSQKEQMENVLTPEQKNQLVQIRANWKAKREAAVAKRMDRMKTRLNLTEDQVAKMKASREASQAKAAAIRENKQLSPEEKKTQLTALRQEQKNNFKQLLTPDQIKKIEDLKKDRMDRQSRK